MIQRIQSIYLFVAAIVTAFTFIFPFAEYLNDNTKYLLNINGLTDISGANTIFNTYPLLLLVILCLIISLLTIMLYKNRPLQARLCNLNILLYVILIAGIFFYSDQAEQELGTENLLTIFKLGSIAPIFAIILTFMANRAIRKDDALVRAADRIR